MCLKLSPLNLNNLSLISIHNELDWTGSPSQLAQPAQVATPVHFTLGQQLNRSPTEAGPIFILSLIESLNHKIQRPSTWFSFFHKVGLYPFVSLRDSAALFSWLHFTESQAAQRLTQTLALSAIMNCSSKALSPSLSRSLFYFYLFWLISLFLTITLLICPYSLRRGAGRACGLQEVWFALREAFNRETYIGVFISLAIFILGFPLVLPLLFGYWENSWKLKNN